jgi:hypothetical protein
MYTCTGPERTGELFAAEVRSFYKYLLGHDFHLLQIGLIFMCETLLNTTEITFYCAVSLHYTTLFTASISV